MAGAAKVAPFAGCVSATAGAALPWTLTMRATDGTPAASTMTSMYGPGGAMLAFAGRGRREAAAPAVNDSGT